VDDRRVAALGPLGERARRGFDVDATSTRARFQWTRDDGAIGVVDARVAPKLRSLLRIS